MTETPEVSPVFLNAYLKLSRDQSADPMVRSADALADALWKLREIVSDVAPGEEVALDAADAALRAAGRIP